MRSVRIDSHLKSAAVISVGLALLSLQGETVDNPIFKVDYHWMVIFLVGFSVWMSLFTFNYFIDKWILNNRNPQHVLRGWIIGAIFTFFFAAIEQAIELKTFRIPEFALTSNVLIGRLLYNSVWLTVITRGVKLALDYFSKSRLEAVDNERLKKENLEIQYSFLQQQLSPHFLFNSLNTLGDLIEHDKKLAVDFLSQFTVMYRYMLNSTTKSLVPLKEELDFLGAYTHILNQRFKDSLKIELDLALTDSYLPPLTLQTLIENAMKHNECSKQYPLTIRIFNSENTICVENNIRARTDVKRNGIGLKNLNSRYLHLTSKPISLSHQQNVFSVKLPYIVTNS